MRRIHDHHGGPDGSIRDCDCPNPPEPRYSARPTAARLATAMRDAKRPPPTGYRDEHEVYHPGPGSRGYGVHAVACAPCLLALNRAIVRGDQWALAIRLAPTLATLLRGPGEGPIAMPTPGPGMQREAMSAWQPLRMRPQHIGPAAVAVGAASYAITALLAWWLAAPMLLGLFALLVYAGLEVDRMPPARLLRR